VCPLSRIDLSHFVVRERIFGVQLDSVVEVVECARKIVFVHANLTAQEVRWREFTIRLKRAIHGVEGLGPELRRESVKHHCLEMCEIEIGLRIL
jgi:hypothetical protein